MLVRRPHDGSFVDDAKATGFHVGQVAANNGARLHNDLAVQDDVLGAAQDGVPADLVTGRLFENSLFIQSRIRVVTTK